MFRISGLVVILLALGASAVHAEEDRSAYSVAQAKLTEQLNAVISKGVELDEIAPPANADGSASERSLAKSERRASS